MTIQGKLIDPWHVELADAVPPGTDAIEIRLVNGQPVETSDVALLTGNPSFDFLRHEPNLYE